MKKQLCIICTETKGKRSCKINSDQLICPKCCAQLRNNDCQGCRYYIKAEKYALEKESDLRSEDYIMRIAPDIDEKVDQALSLVEKGNIHVGEGILKSLLKSAGDIHTVQFGMGVVRAMQRNYEEAKVYFDKSLEINPYSVEGWFNKAVAHKKLFEISEMIKSLQKVVELGASTDELVYEAKKLLRDFEHHVRTENGISLSEYMMAEEKFNAGYAAMESKDWQEAVKCFQQSIGINAKHPQCFGNLGLCYGFLGQKEKALEALDQALTLDPDYEPAINNRIAIAKLKDGEKLMAVLHSIDYYKDKR